MKNVSASWIWWQQHIPCRINDAFPQTLMHLHTIRDAGFWTECWQQPWRSLSSLVRKMWHPQILIYLATEQFSTLSPSILNELWPTEDGSFSGSCGFFFAWQSFNLHLWLTRQTAFTDWCLEVFVSPCSDFHDRIMSGFFCGAAWGPRDHRHPVSILIKVPCTQRCPLIR